MNKQEAMRQVEKWRTDAAYDRARGDEQSEADMLAARLIEALTDPGHTDTHAGRRP